MERGSFIGGLSAGDGNLGGAGGRGEKRGVRDPGVREKPRPLRPAPGDDGTAEDSPLLFLPFLAVSFFFFFLGGGAS